jgi:magnesium-transporting ATPase (P-type)
VEANEAIPADMVLLLSSNEEGIAYMETSQLDGYSSARNLAHAEASRLTARWPRSVLMRRETNLKQRKVPPVTAGKTKEELADMKGVLKCEKPNHILYSFKGTAAAAAAAASTDTDPKAWH